ncbi:uncharacterized protein PAC_05582 [Phialocephala subalpina]|uniref:beta-glucosidase n=1 Tax=Phialocephala subalpina TaxID=576137 RepID=A0A1L7WSE0_9HELO|nr:uncharacterized protein PAC_05582 [Phialocephala subalpina]
MSSVPHSQDNVNIDSLLTQLTIDEKISLLAGANVTDGPNGARGSQFFDGTTVACLPAYVSIAATFDRELTKRIGVALDQESQTIGTYVLGPTVCSHRSSLGGRNFEAFSEDSPLSGVLAAEHVKGLESERVGTTIKHFLGNEGIYLPPFEIVVKTADPWCLEFLQNILRQEWKYPGLVMSDWGATTSTAESLNAGVDLEMPVEQIKPAIEVGTVTENAINDRARAVLELPQKTGKSVDRKVDIAEIVADLLEHRKLIRQAGAEGIVLLKNAENVLPLDRSKCKEIALLGPLARYAAAHGGRKGKLGVRFTTTYTPTITSSPYLSFSTKGPSKLYINDTILFEQPYATKDSMSFLLSVQDELQSQYPLEARKSYKIRIDTIPSPEPNGELYLLDGQIAAHLDADVAIVFVGNTAQWETEGQDMDDMNLPADGPQDRLIAAVAAVNPRAIAWYAVLESGNAIFDVLFEAVNPSGRLLISWLKEYEHTAVYRNFDMDSYQSRQVEYVEGVFVGYRHFDRMWGTEKEVRWPFGFGLSYTNFQITNAKVEGGLDDSGSSGLVITADVENVGCVAGAEVVQVYLLPPSSGSEKQPVKSLAGFTKTRLEICEKRNVFVSIILGRRLTGMLREGNGRWMRAHTGWVSMSSSPVDKKAELK